MSPMTTAAATHAEMPPVLSVEGLTTSFLVDGQWRSVVRNISFDVKAGETVAIVGESGSGKSVTSLSIMCLLAPDTSRVEGRVLLNGRDILALSEKDMQKVRGNEAAMIFQEPMTSLNPIFTIGRQISEVLTRHKGMSKTQARAETIRMLEKVRIPNAAGRFDDYPHQYSGGMRQRVMIAMALASRPNLLIADEPTTALDVTIQGQILDLIKELQEEEGMSVLFITHDMGVVAEIADRTIVMLRGDVVEEGPTADVFHRGQHPYTRALLAAVPTTRLDAWPCLAAALPDRRYRLWRGERSIGGGRYGRYPENAGAVCQEPGDAVRDPQRPVRSPDRGRACR